MNTEIVGITENIGSLVFMWGTVGIWLLCLFFYLDQRWFNSTHVLWVYSKIFGGSDERRDKK